MRSRLAGSVIGAVFGLAYVIVNAGPLPDLAGTVVRVLGALAFVAVLASLARSRSRVEDPGEPGAGFGRAYWLVVAAEVVAIVVGVRVVAGPLGAPAAGVAWVSVVVGLHLVALAEVFRRRFFRWLGAALTLCGLVALGLGLSGAPTAAVAGVGGVAPGFLLLGWAWWGSWWQPGACGQAGAPAQPRSVHTRR